MGQSMEQHGTRTINKRYRIKERIGAGGMGIVFRAFDLLMQEDIALKQVRLSYSIPENSAAGSFDVQLALAREFRTMASLRHPHIISVRDYGFDFVDGLQQPYFTMDLLHDAQNIIQAAKGQPLDVKLRLIMQTLQAVAYLHRRGIVHRDIKPDNVMVVNDEVQVLDFGLAFAREQSGDQDNYAAGTLAYIAPEILQGKGSSHTSDLYAVGMIAYEMLSETYPFDKGNMGLLITSIVSEIPDCTLLDAPQPICNMVATLLAKNPQDRHINEYEAIRIVSQAMTTPIVDDTDIIRESFLQAARFVGRRDALDKLINAIDDLQHNKGSTWLIGGESGIGKSRLLDELRIRALVQGLIVLQGSASQTPYKIWRSVIRNLALNVTLTDDEASVLKTLVSDIDAVIGRDVQVASDKDTPEQNMNRLTRILSDIIMRLEHPTILLLDDIQWIDTGSLRLLQSIQHTIKQAPVPLLIVSCYRRDDRPTMSEALLDAEHFTLERLNPTEIEDLSVSILGDIIGRQENILTLLKRETEGNIFFIVEVLRVLAQEAGHLEYIGQIELPKSVFAQGIETVVQRRLSRLPQAAQVFLQYAAIIGRDIDLPVLREATNHNNATIERLLTLCAEATVLEVQDNTWRFAHDKLRTAILSQIPEAQARQRYSTSAEAVEAVYDDRALWLAKLADWWRKAGDTDHELGYAYMAGEQAFYLSSFQQAVDFFERVYDLTQSSLIAYRLAKSYQQMGNIDKAQTLYEQALALAWKSSNSTLIANAASDLAMIAYNKQDYEISVGYLQQSLQIYRQTNNTGGEERILNQLGAVYIELGDEEQALKYYRQGLSVGRGRG